MPPATLPGPFAMLTTSSHLPRRCLAYRTLQLWSLCALWSSICIAVHKPRAFHYCGLSVEPEAPEALVIHSAGWIPHTALIRTHGLFKSLGVEYPINPSDSTSLRTMKLKLLVSIKALSVKKATPRSINLVMAKCLYARGAYVGILSSWSLRECEEIDSIFASELRRRSKNLRTSQAENLYQPVREGGLGFQRVSSMVQQRKRNCIHRVDQTRGPGSLCSWPPQPVSLLPRCPYSPENSPGLLDLLPTLLRFPGQRWPHQTPAVQTISCPG